MKEINFENIKHIFFVGIGGISQSALAKLSLSLGKKVSGSDKHNSLTLDELESLGVKVYHKHNNLNIEDDVDLVVFSSAISENNTEIIYAKSKKINLLSRAEFLGLISHFYKHIIAVSGIHGKTTTTGMIASIFLSAKLNPTIHIGGVLNNINSTLRVGGNEYFITEACEYQDSFLSLNPECSIILNIEMEHTDYYKNFEQISNSFNKFANNSKNVFIGEQYKSLINKKNQVTLSVNGNSDFIARNIKQTSYGTSFEIIKNGEYFDKVKIKTFGVHNVYNALFAVGVADYYNISKNFIKKGLENFKGIKRRFEFCGKTGNAILFQDYAHHPTEIKTTLKTFKSIFKIPIICIYQPHTYSRTKNLFGQFLDAFNDCDELFILPTYSAREKSSMGYNSVKLYKSLSKVKDKVQYLKSKKEAKKILKLYKNRKCVLVVMGAGDINKIIIND